MTTSAKHHSLRGALNSTWPLLLGMGILMLGAGLQGTLNGVRAALAGFPTSVIGLVMSCYYVGYMLGSFYVPRLIRNVGHVRVFAALSAAAACALLLQSNFVNPWFWALMRIASGFCFAGLYLVAESWLNDCASNQNRGALLSVYMVVIYSGLGTGQFLLILADAHGHELFMLTAGLIAIALVPTALGTQPAPDYQIPEAIKLRDLFQCSPLGVVGIAISGMIGGSLFAMGPVYAQSVGLDATHIAWFMAVTILAAVITQLPIGRYSDRVDRRSVLIAVCLLGSVAALGAVWLAPHSLGMLLLTTAIMGGMALTVYALSLSHVNDHLNPKQMVAASSALILLNGAGAACGPTLVATAMACFGSRGYFITLAALLSGLGLYGAWRKLRRAPVPPEQKIHFVAAQPQAATAPMLAEAAASADST